MTEKIQPKGIELIDQVKDLRLTTYLCVDLAEAQACHGTENVELRDMGGIFVVYVRGNARQAL